MPGEPGVYSQRVVGVITEVAFGIFWPSETWP